MNSFHFISIDKKSLAEVHNHPWTNSIVKLHESQEKLTTYLEPANDNFVFLDIDFHTKSESVKSIVKLDQMKSKVIVVSQDTTFAYSAIKAGAHDYILKSDLMKNVLLICRQYSANSPKSIANKIAIHCNDAIHYLSLGEIIRCKAESNYTWIITKEKNILIAKTLKKIEALLPSATFYRTHRSHIVNLKHIKMVKHEKGGTIVTSDNHDTPISRSRKSFYLDKIQSAIM